MSRSISIEELNKRIDAKNREYEEDEAEAKKRGDYALANQYFAMIKALHELKIDLNDPEAVEDITENVQQTLNVIETKKIIDNEL